MPAPIQKLTVKDGTSYSMGQPWPGSPADGREQLKVGPIFFLPGEEDNVVDEKGEVIAAMTQPSRYEVWCVTDRLLSVFIGQLRGVTVPPAELQHLVESKQGMTRRVIYVDHVASTDEEWPAVAAFRKLVDRYVEMNEESDDDPSAPVAAPVVQGNGATQSA